MSVGKLIKMTRQSLCSQACSARIIQTDCEIDVKPKFGSIAGVFALRRSDAQAIREAWRAEFAEGCHQTAISNIRKLFWAATLLNLVALVAYDLPLYLNGLFEQHRMYGDLVIWRLANIVSLGGFAPSTPAVAGHRYEQRYEGLGAETITVSPAASCGTARVCSARAAPSGCAGSSS